MRPYILVDSRHMDADYKFAFSDRELVDINLVKESNVAPARCQKWAYAKGPPASEAS